MNAVRRRAAASPGRPVARCARPSFFAAALAAALVAAASAGPAWTTLSYGEGPVFYPPLPETPRLQFLTSYSTGRDFGRSESWFARFIFGSSREEGLGKPYGVAVHGAKVYLCDTTAGDVRILDLARRELGWLASPARVRLKKPVNITVDEKGVKFVADTGLDRVIAFDAQDRYVRSYQDPAGWKPTDVAASGAVLYVVDIDNHQIAVVDRAEGKILRRIGGPGSGEGQLFKPTNIALDPAGNLFVSDTINFRIQKFSPEGKFLGGIGQLGRAPGTFSRPKGIALDRQGRLYVVDAAFDNIQIFDPEGRALLFFGGTGNDPGQMYLPAKLALDYDPDNIRKFQALADRRLRLAYLVWVTNQYGPHRVSVYGFGDWREDLAVP